MDLFNNITNLLRDRAKDHVREGNIEKANQYIDQLSDLLITAMEHIDTLEKEK